MTSDECPVLSLPDEVLCHILSFITEVPLKMSLESVCNRLNWISTNHKNSWKGNDSLEIIIGAPWTDGDLYSQPVKFLARYNNLENGHYYLNTCKVAFPNWPKAIEQLLQRTVIRKLCIHLFEDDWEFKMRDRKHFRRALDVIQDHPIKLNHIEFQNIEFPYPNIDRRASDLYHWAVANSAQILKSIMLFRAFKRLSIKKWMQFCSGVRWCLNLESFVTYIYSMNGAPPHSGRMMQLSEALQGKPLERLAVCSEAYVTRLTGNELTQFLHPICANNQSRDIKTLMVDMGETHSLINFGASLHPPTAQSLVELSIYNVSSLDTFLPGLEHVPAMFPNLTTLHLFDPCFLDICEDYAELQNENLLLNRHYFLACDQTPAVSRKVVISLVLVKDVDGFEARMAELCEREKIRAVFAEEEEDEDGLIKMGSITLNYANPYVTMTKGQGAIVIIGITQSDSEHMDIDIDDEY